MMQFKEPEEIAKLNILSLNRLAFILQTDVKRLGELAENVESHYLPFKSPGRKRYFQKSVPKSRPIDNPSRQLKAVQDKIHKRLLRVICFPNHIIGGVPKRSVLDNAERHLGAALLVTIDVRKCFPSITNKQVYHVWRNVLGCSPPASALLTRLTTYKRYLPQGSPASPLIANLLIWSIDKSIREASAERDLAYSTFIDDLAFSGARAREMIQIAAAILASHGLRISHSKIRIMGAKSAKLLTGTRLGRFQIRAPKEKLSRIRSGVHKLKIGLVLKDEIEIYVDSLVGQLRYIERLNLKDSQKYAFELAHCTGEEISTRAKKFLEARSIT